MRRLTITRHTFLPIIAALLTGAFSLPISAETNTARAQPSDASERGRTIAEEAWARGNGFGSLRAEVEMTIITRSGQQASRRLEIALLEGEGEASKALTRVESPRDVAGTALLTHTDSAGAQQQWLYLPAASRTRRISSENRSGSFMGSEFSFDDFGAQPPSRYNFQYLREASLNGMPCHVIERHPRADRQGHEIAWLDKERLLLQRVEYYDANGDKTRVLTVEDYKSYPGADGKSYWRATSLRMDNARTDAASVLRWEDIELGAGLDTRDFEVAALPRRR
ncbi:outer membrane lipoprotein-sorting protein [Algiphilus sp.]|uniref:outer membrane lipoprotein-sorting protein n=1 Tax=Algiphilus sp. TaxID=1872431 RepID=UPI0032ED3B00